MVEPINNRKCATNFEVLGYYCVQHERAPSFGITTKLRKLVDSALDYGCEAFDMEVNKTLLQSKQIAEIGQAYFMEKTAFTRDNQLPSKIKLCIDVDCDTSFKEKVKKLHENLQEMENLSAMQEQFDQVRPEPESKPDIDERGYFE